MIAGPADRTHVGSPGGACVGAPGFRSCLQPRGFPPEPSTKGATRTPWPALRGERERDSYSYLDGVVPEGLPVFAAHLPEAGAAAPGTYTVARPTWGRLGRWGANAPSLPIMGSTWAGHGPPRARGGGGLGAGRQQGSRFGGQLRPGPRDALPPLTPGRARPRALQGHRGRDGTVGSAASGTEGLIGTPVAAAACSLPGSAPSRLPQLLLGDRLPCMFWLSLSHVRTSVIQISAHKCPLNYLCC